MDADRKGFRIGQCWAGQGTHTGHTGGTPEAVFTIDREPRAGHTWSRQHRLLGPSCGLQPWDLPLLDSAPSWNIPRSPWFQRGCGKQSVSSSLICPWHQSLYFVRGEGMWTCFVCKSGYWGHASCPIVRTLSDGTRDSTFCLHSKYSQHIGKATLRICLQEERFPRIIRETRGYNVLVICRCFFPAAMLYVCFIVRKSVCLLLKSIFKISSSISYILKERVVRKRTKMFS